IPILMASVVLRPWASFVAAGVCGLVISGMAVYILGGIPPIPTLAGFFAVALVSWLSANSLEQALKELRIINIELDQRVEDRTRELAEANRELAEAYSQLQELDRLKSRFVSMVSHELRTPLNAILGFVEMLQAQVYGEINEAQITPLNRIVANTQRLLGIVNDLLDQARMDAGLLSIHVAPFSPHDLVDDLHSTVGVLAESKGLSLTTHIVENVPETLLGDRQRWHQLTVNLVNNAVKFTKEGGVHVQINLPDPEHWALVVSDTGPGIPDEAMGYIFDAFRQVDSSATREHQGTGLGLAIVKQLVELMGGEINVTSKLDYGSTFTVVLPLTPPQEAKNG
ncbi:MAG: hypothetical protein JW981_09090, partial [Anaerolineae bacterium]|nr:hypothetical protein [Anaerolineae bacterium]